jgi:hypothetical protein
MLTVARNLGQERTVAHHNAEGLTSNRKHPNQSCETAGSALRLARCYGYTLAYGFVEPLCGRIM